MQAAPRTNREERSADHVVTMKMVTENAKSEKAQLLALPHLDLPKIELPKIEVPSINKIIQSFNNDPERQELYKNYGKLFLRRKISLTPGFR